MTAKGWAIFGAVQGLGLALVNAGNIHTAAAPILVGYLLLSPGIFVSFAISFLKGPVQVVLFAILINAVCWYLVAKLRRK